MLFGVVRGPSFEEAVKQLERALPLADGVEFRFDLFSFHEIEELLARWPKLNLFTCRGASKEKIWELLSYGPDFFDVDCREDHAFLQEAKRQFLKTRWIVSYHDHEGMPSDLGALLAQMKKIPAVIYKIAVSAKSSLDALRMLCFVQKHPEVIGIAMGEEGRATRILGPIVGNLITYAALGEPVAGQLDIEELCHIYRNKFLKENDPVYALLGDPVRYGTSHVHHNQALKEGVYVKLKVTPEELEDFRALAAQLPFKGFSVTMPLKQLFLSDTAINTIAIREDSWDYTNTDGPAAADLIEKHIPLLGKRCMILGAGGVAEGFAKALIERGAKVTLANRTKTRALALGTKLGSSICDLDALPDYDVLIQATSVGMAPNPDEMPIAEEQILPHRLVLEAIKTPRETKFLQAARARHCPIIDGEDLWHAQALLQHHFWNIHSSNQEKSGTVTGTWGTSRGGRCRC